MSKKLISILLAVVLAFSLFPAAALAADGDSPDVNPATGREPGPKGSEKVALLVYGESIAEAVISSDYSIDDFWSALQTEVQGILANEKLPEVEVYLVNDQNQEYKLEVSDGTGASWLNSFQFDTGGIFGFLDYILDWLTDIYDWLMESVPTVGELYKIYRADNIPRGDYTLEVRKINGDGYTLWRPEDGITRVHVGDDSMNYIGYNQLMGEHEFDIEMDFGIFDVDIDVLTISVTMPGLYLRSEEPGITFRSADLGGHGLEGTDFVMINRDETLNIVNAAFALGKDTFTNAINLVGTEGFTWAELSLLRSEMLQWDSDACQITFNEDNAFKLLETYWALVAASGRDPLFEFLNEDTNIRLPAILKATSDENGYVSFTESSNVTLLWTLQILMKMGNLVMENFTEEDIDAIHFDDKETESLVKVIYWILQYALKEGEEYWDENTGTVNSAINNWIYPLMQNDNLSDYAISILKLIKGKSFVEENMDVLQWLPDHAFLTSKMPTGSYIMLETSVPDGYLRNPMFYTINLEWHTESSDPRDWCYANVGNLGLIVPYFAEDYYAFLRNSNAAAMADDVLSKLTRGFTGTIIQDTLSGQTDVTAMTIAYQAHLIYNSLGGNLIYSSELELAQALTKYLYSYGRTTQNLLMFASNVAKEAKSVVSSEIDENWTFYNFSTSLRTNIALQVQSVLRGMADSIDTTGYSPIQEATQKALNQMADNIDTTNRIIETTTAISNQVKETVSNVVTGVAKGIFNSVMSVGKWIVKQATK